MKPLLCSVVVDHLRRDGALLIASLLPVLTKEELLGVHVMPSSEIRVGMVAADEQPIKAGQALVLLVGDEAQLGTLAEADELLKALQNERDGWRETAELHTRNELFYHDLISQIGEPFGIAAKTSDDGSVQEDVLALKVPELVLDLFQQVADAKASLQSLKAVNRDPAAEIAALEAELQALRDANAKLAEEAGDSASAEVGNAGGTPTLQEPDPVTMPAEETSADSAAEPEKA